MGGHLRIWWPPSARPYDASCWRPTVEQTSLATDFKIESALATRHPERADDIKGQLALKNPVIVGMDVTPSFERLEAGEVYRLGASGIHLDRTTRFTGGQVADCTAGAVLLQQMPDVAILHGDTPSGFGGETAVLLQGSKRYKMTRNRPSVALGQCWCGQFEQKTETAWTDI